MIAVLPDKLNGRFLLIVVTVMTGSIPSDFDDWNTSRGAIRHVLGVFFGLCRH
jgi:hypothetical protein